MTPHETINSAEPGAERKEGPLLRARIDRDLKEGMGPATAFARQLSEDPFWPIGLCIAWALRPDVAEAVELYARHRVGLGVREVDSWREAQATLVRALAGKRIEASGVRPEERLRASIPAQDWIDLRIMQRGPYDEVTGPDGSIAYRDVRIEAAAMRRQWRPETQALKTVRERRGIEKACLSELMERMRKTPSDPVPKIGLKSLFPNVSARAFDRLYSQAVQQSGCLAWSKGGRRPTKTPRA